jgi:hypothetical protein
MVLRLLKGEGLDLLSRELKVNAATRSSRREVLVSAGLAGLNTREIDARDEEDQPDCSFFSIPMRNSSGG